MKKLRIPNTLLTFGVIIGLLFSTTPTTHAFTSVKFQFGWQRDKITLIDKVHQKHWDIAYAYGADCPAAKKAGGKKFEGDITSVLQKWLQPLREIKTKAPIVNAFRYQLHDEITLEVREKVDLAILDTCEIGNSQAALSTRRAPAAVLRVLADTDEWRIRALLHELGHTFGLGDTYVNRNERNQEVPSVSKGGLNKTIGTQPAAVMSIHIERVGVDFLTEDDENGIIYLYKIKYEGLPVNDCLFPHYQFEKSPDGCVPKYPLIFEIRQGFEIYALRILDEDPNIDINAQNAIGYTALHYAVTGKHRQFLNRLLNRDDINVNLKDARGKTPLHYAVSDESVSIVEKLLAHKDILANVEDNMGRTPLDIATELEHEKLMELLDDTPEEIEELAVIAKMKLATTWASLKRH